jgi:colanic acid/amylovoran biosynthesis glycosyltransferase
MTQANVTVLEAVLRWLPLTENWIHNQLRFLPDTVAWHVVCDDTENLDRYGVALIHSRSDVPHWQRIAARALRRVGVRRHDWFMESVASRTGARLLHSHFGHVGWANLGTVRRRKLKHIVTFYGFDVNYLPQQEPRWKERYHQLFAEVDLVLCEGPHMASCIAGLGCPTSKLCVHHLGVPLDQLRFRPRRWAPDEPLRVLMAASFQEKKGLPVGLAALGRLPRELAVTVTLIGDANSEPRSQREKARILAAVEACGLHTKVRMLGYQPHDVLMREAYEHHVFLSPSLTASDGDTEGGAPVSIIEMAASGMPVISTRHCDIPEVLRPGDTRLLAEEGDPEGLAACLTCLTEHRDDWPAMLAPVRRHIESQYDARCQGEGLERIYRETVGK